MKTNVPKCKRCKTEKKGLPVALHRLYIRTQKGFKGIGWICPKCGRVFRLQVFQSDRKSEKKAD